MNTKKYKKVTKLTNKHNFSDFDLISNYGLTLGDKSIYKIFTLFKAIERISNIKGDIIEFGVWKGNNAFMIKKMLNFLNIKKKIYLFDHFKGLTHYTKNKDPKISEKYFAQTALAGTSIIMLMFFSVHSLSAFKTNSFVFE